MPTPEPTLYPTEAPTVDPSINPSFQPCLSPTSASVKHQQLFHPASHPPCLYQDQLSILPKHQL
jgi:hypothetical protein